VLWPVIKAVFPYHVMLVFHRHLSSKFLHIVSKPIRTRWWENQRGFWDPSEER